MPNESRGWYALKVKADAAELSIFEEIGGWGVPVSEFKREFDAIKGAAEIRLTMNCPGGDVFGGMALYNVLSSVRPKLTIEVVGAACSIASIVALAGRELVMDEGTFLMIHKPWAGLAGNADELRAVADTLDKIGGEMAGIYAANSNLSREDALARMKEETWYTAAEAVEAGFADSVKDHGEIAALMRVHAHVLSRYRNVPERLRAAAAQAQAQAQAHGAEADPVRGGGGSQIEEGAMKLSDVMEFLGSAKPEEKATMAQALGLADAQALTKELVELKSQVATLTEVNAGLKKKFEGQAAKDLAKRKADVIEAALREGRILPKDRAKWEARFDEQPDFAAAVIADLPKAIDYETHGHGGGGGEPAGDVPEGFTAEDVQAMKVLHMSEADYRKHKTAHDAAEKSSRR